MKKWNYYNDFDPKVCAWAKELIKKGLVPDGEVDCRSITEVQADDLRGFVQCHFFCGILGWSYALRLAGWPDDRPVWTGSCPCQPFSCAGKGEGTADKRHLWPEFFRLIRECRPERVFGEQVEAAIGKGWLDGVFADLEGEGYTCGAAVLGAHSVGAPHIRQRLYWMAAHTDGRDASTEGLQRSGEHGQQPQDARAGEQREQGCAGVGRDRPTIDGEAGGMGDTPSRGQRIDGGTPGSSGHTDKPSEVAAGAWSDFYIVHCRDGKARRVGSGVTPLAHGIPARVVRLRGYGNAIVPQAAAEFIKACEEVTA